MYSYIYNIWLFNIAMERSTIFNGKTDYKWAINRSTIELNGPSKSHGELWIRFPTRIIAAPCYPGVISWAALGSTVSLQANLKE